MPNLGRAMYYLKSLCYNFLTVFFANYLIPGIEIVNPTKLPCLKGDILFAVVVGFLSSLIYPVLKGLDQRISYIRIAAGSCGIALISYAILKFAPIGIEIKTITGFFLGAAVVAAGGFITNLFEMRQSMKFPRPPEMPHI